MVKDRDLLHSFAHGFVLDYHFILNKICRVTGNSAKLNILVLKRRVKICEIYDKR